MYNKSENILICHVLSEQTQESIFNLFNQLQCELLGKYGLLRKTNTHKFRLGGYD